MMRSLTLIFCSLSLSAFAGPSKRASSGQLAELQHQIDRIIQTADPNVHVGVEIVSLKNNQKIYHKNSDHLFVPSSSLKLFTAGAALVVLGSDYKFETKLLHTGKVGGSLLDGDLYLKGSGDPEFAIKDLEELIFQLKLRGIKTIKGNLIIDNFDFDAVTQGPGWMWDEGAEYWNSPMDALTVNHSCVDVWVKPAKEPAKPPSVYLYPKTSYLSVHNQAMSNEEKGELSVSRRWMAKENVIQIKGVASMKSLPVRFEIPVESPHLYTANLFAELLQRQGIELQGEILTAKAPAEASEIATHRSSPLAILLQKMLKSSDNLYADCLYKKVGQVHFNTQGTWTNGGQAVREFLEKKVSLPIADLVVLDGCGQSRYNLVSPHQMTAFLAWIYQQYKYAPEFLAALPIAGTDGTLKLRLTDSTTKGRIRAKTGTMTGMTSLAGYAVTKEGEPLALTIFINGFVKSPRDYKKQIEDPICSLLTQFSRD